MSDTSAPLLAVEHLESGYGDLRVVWDVSLTVHAGSISVLLGRNGAGKTTTLRAITGLNKVTGGTLTYDGANLLDLSPSKRVSEGISYVQEGKRIFRDLTVEQNLLLGGYSTRTGRRGLRPVVESIYELFPILEEKRTLPAGSMSGGQQQMLAIGQALMAKPRLLILDEPSQGLAPVIVKEVMQQVHSLTSTGIGILLIEQDVADSIAIADHVSVVDMGRTVLSAPAADIKDSDLRSAYFGASV